MRPIDPLIQIVAGHPGLNGSHPGFDFWVIRLLHRFKGEFDALPSFGGLQQEEEDEGPPCVCLCQVGRWRIRILHEFDDVVCVGQGLRRLANPPLEGAQLNETSGQSQIVAGLAVNVGGPDAKVMGF
jgi:hypothetical protein